MRTRDKKNFMMTACTFLLFVIYTLALTMIDVQPIGTNGSMVGFATINKTVHELLGVHLALYTMTDWLSIIAAVIVLGFAGLGLYQLITRKNLLKVDLSILTLGGFYVVVLCAYLFFEHVVINYRPVLIENVMEVSYPSSTTMLVLCVMGTAVLQFKRLIKNPTTLKITLIASYIFTGAMVLTRLISGVHWFTDIIGGILLSATLVMLYCSVTNYLTCKISK